MVNILIVDDDPAAQITVQLILERAGQRVTVAGDGRKGLRAIPDLAQRST